MNLRASIIDAGADHLLVSSSAGDFAIVDSSCANALLDGTIGKDHPRWDDFQAKGFVSGDPALSLRNVVATTRKSFLLEGPSLHIFVVTLRCDHSCQYCQVSRAAENADGFDMSQASADAAIERVFESDASALTIEFQGGEPALRFDLVRYIVDKSSRRSQRDGRTVRFTMATTLQRLSDEDLLFCKENNIHLSTSIDGPALIHNVQRARPGGAAWERTTQALARARLVLGHEGVAALPTITRAMLADPEALVDAYLDLGFRSIFLRPLSPYGFARKTQRTLGYSVDEFLAFYVKALNYILKLNREGVQIEETYASILLRHILTPYHSGYVDIRSPAGAGLGVIVYNYDGLAYPSDEARMAAETGDQRFALGPVTDPLDQLLASDPMRWLATGAVAEQLPGCRTCAFVPFCGADPVHHAIIHGDPVGRREESDFCARQTGLFKTLFSKIAARDPDTLRTFYAWAFQRPRDSVAADPWIDA